MDRLWAQRKLRSRASVTAQRDGELSIAPISEVGKPARRVADARKAAVFAGSSVNGQEAGCFVVDVDEWLRRFAKHILEVIARHGRLLKVHVEHAPLGEGAHRSVRVATVDLDRQNRDRGQRLWRATSVLKSQLHLGIDRCLTPDEREEEQRGAVKCGDDTVPSVIRRPGPC